MDKKLHEKFQKVKIFLYQASADSDLPECRFFFHLLGKLNIFFGKTPEIPIAATDGLSIFFNSSFIENCEVEQIATVTLHELGHILNKHIEFTELKTLDQKIANIAGDHLINIDLEDWGFEFPEVKYYADRRFENKSFKEVYEILLKEKSEEEENDENNEIGEDLYAPGSLTPEGITDQASQPKDVVEKAYAEVRKNVSEANTTMELTKSWGEESPSELQKTIKKFLASDIDYVQLLNKYFDSYNKDDYSYSRPNKRYAAYGLYLPSLRNLSLEGALAAFDVSGSMCEKALSTVWSSIVDFWQKTNPKWLNLITFNTKLVQNIVYNQGDAPEPSIIRSGGGTRIEPVFEEIKKKNPTFALIMTDGYFKVPDETLNSIASDLIWIIIDNPDFSHNRLQDEVIHISTT